MRKTCYLEGKEWFFSLSISYLNLIIVEIWLFQLLNSFLQLPHWFIMLLLSFFNKDCCRELTEFQSSKHLGTQWIVCCTASQNPGVFWCRQQEAVCGWHTWPHPLLPGEELALCWSVLCIKIPYKISFLKPAVLLKTLQSFKNTYLVQSPHFPMHQDPEKCLS